MRAWCTAFILFVCFNFTQAEAEKEFKIPSYVDLCYRDDPKVNDCIKKDVEKLLPIFKNGSEEFNLEPIDPMLFEVLKFNYKSGILGGRLNISDAYIHGLSTAKIKDVRTKLNEPEKFKMEMDVYLPYMNLKSNYHLKGNVIKIPVDMKGRVDVLFESVNITYKISGDVKTIDDLDYLVLDKFTWNFLAEGIHKCTLRNKDVVDGKPALNRMVRTVVNSNWRPLVKQMLPVILPESDKKMKYIFTKFFKTFPYDVIFPKHSATSDDKKPKTDNSITQDVKTADI